MDPFIGEIRAFAGNFAPVGWFLCQGQTLPIAQYQALFAIIGTTYGGNGTSDFQLPNLQGQTMVGVGTSPSGQVYELGQTGGAGTTATVSVQNTGSGTPVSTLTPYLAISYIIAYNGIFPSRG
jgi:microcystin-dependent protein